MSRASWMAARQDCADVAMLKPMRASVSEDSLLLRRQTDEVRFPSSALVQQLTCLQKLAASKLRVHFADRSLGQEIPLSADANLSLSSSAARESPLLNADTLKNYIFSAAPGDHAVAISQDLEADKFPSLIRKDSGTMVFSSVAHDNINDMIRATRRSTDWPVLPLQSVSSQQQLPYRVFDANSTAPDLPVSFGYTAVPRHSYKPGGRMHSYSQSYCAPSMTDYSHNANLNMRSNINAGLAPPYEETNLVKQQTACRFFQESYCSRGNRCTFAHIPNGNNTSIESLSLGQNYFRSTLSNSDESLTNISLDDNHQTFFNLTPSSMYTPGYSTNQMNHINLSNTGNYDYISSLNNSMSNLGNDSYRNNITRSQKRYDQEANRFNNVKLEDLIGQIYTLSKDQYGCRYLQKKLEENNPKSTSSICDEVHNHFGELMTDPFGNYLCQKLIEHCTDDERTKIVEQVAPELFTISLNMHGTRAAQKMVECLSNQRQVHAVVNALTRNIVTLMKDLNGNHVVQRCLNRFEANDNQFIYDAATQHCVEIATHRHGTCVLQRCIDHASDTQKIQLVTEISYNALSLVQDPFGNYVVQYVLDLGRPELSEGLIRRFLGNVCILSMQKFSSNVMEKCIRVAEPEMRRKLINKLIDPEHIEKLLRDLYANYVVQTSMDYAEPIQRSELIECIRPILPLIRNTPYGKRIQSKFQREELFGGPSLMYNSNATTTTATTTTNNTSTTTNNGINHGSRLIGVQHYGNAFGGYPVAATTSTNSGHLPPEMMNHFSLVI